MISSRLGEREAKRTLLVLSFVFSRVCGLTVQSLTPTHTHASLVRAWRQYKHQEQHLVSLVTGKLW